MNPTTLIFSYPCNLNVFSQLRLRVVMGIVVSHKLLIRDQLDTAIYRCRFESLTEGLTDKEGGDVNKPVSVYESKRNAVRGH